uniref:Coiled-coil domain-containing protein 39 n=1 Tax=Physcomitrium patens TaxID=3218 RepID=A0A2K1IAS3_PHYPA|nr:hypothetical protein PHYPA_030958 [Physcomitrium patens]
MAQISESDEDWDNVDDWGGDASLIEGVVAPALRETAISPTTSWDEDDEPWPPVQSRGMGQPRIAAPGVRWDESVAGSEDVRPEISASLPPSPMEGVLSPAIADRQVNETFAWAPNNTWERGEAPTRGLGRPMSEVERLEELRRGEPDRHGEIMTATRPREELADDTRGLLIQDQDHMRRASSPPVEGVLSSRAAAEEEIASTFNLGEYTLQGGPEGSADRGIGQPRGEQERQELLRQQDEELDDGWASSHGIDIEEMRRQLPDADGVIAEGPREEDTFAESFAWGVDGDDWALEERTVSPGRGTGYPIPPHVRHELGRLPMTAYELELLQNQTGRPTIIPGDWAVNLPRGEAVVRGDEVEAWQRVMAPTGPLPALQSGRVLMQDPGFDKNSDATPSSFNTDKQFELMKDKSMRFLPDFANDENRELNIMVQEAERQLREVEDATQEQDDRTTVMEDHMKQVQEEITATQQRVEAKRKEIQTEQHLITMTTFQTARLKQELEQWKQAALQKYEDFVALESYQKYDDTRIKALRLDEVKASGDLTRVRKLLEAEMAETHSYQVQLHKTAVEFRYEHDICLLHTERQEVIRQWERTIEMVHTRDKDIHRITEDFAANQQLIRREKRILDNCDLKLYNASEKRADMEKDIHSKNLDAQKQKEFLKQEMEKLKRAREALVNIKSDHFRNQHQYAKEVAKKAFFQEEVKRQKKMYQEARQQLKELREKVEDEYSHLDTLEKRTHTLEKLLHTEELNYKLAQKEVTDLQERHYKNSRKLFSLRASERDTIHEIKGGKSIAKTLVNRIAILEIELLKKEEKLYAADFQIQLLEGKVGRASGERSNAEEIETTRQVKELEAELDLLKKEEQAINDQMKKSVNEMRKSSRRKEDLETRKRKLNEKNAELSVECDAGMIGNKAMTKEREETALEDDLLQMEVQRLTDLLHSKADEVFNLDRLKQRLNKNMEDRKAEVDARQEVQRREMKIIAEELHDLKLKRQNLVLKIDKLQCKYDCLRARMKTSDGVELTAEFYLDQMKSQREEIQKKGLDLSEKLRKARVDVNFLESAAKQITDSNNNLRTSLTENEKTIELEEESEKLKGDLQKSRDRARFKLREERSLLRDLVEVEVKVQNREEELKTASNTSENLEYRIEHARKGIEEQTTKRKRAAARLNLFMRELRERAPPEEAKRICGEFVLSETRESAKDVLHKLKQLGMENPDYAQIIETRVNAEGFKLPTGPGSTRSSGSSGDSVVSLSSRIGKGKSKSPSRFIGDASTSTVFNMEFKGSGPSPR